MSSTIISLLAEGDMRTTGNVDEVVKEVQKNPILVKTLIEALEHPHSGVRMRAADALEKTVRSNSTQLQVYKNTILAIFKTATQQEVQWHLAQILPRLSLKVDEKEEVINILQNIYMNAKSSILKTFSIQAMVDLVQEIPSKQSEIKRIVEDAIESGTPAMKSRAKKLIKSF